MPLLEQLVRHELISDPEVMRATISFMDKWTMPMLVRISIKEGRVKVVENVVGTNEVEVFARVLVLMLDDVLEPVVVDVLVVDMLVVALITVVILVESVGHDTEGSATPAV